MTARAPFLACILVLVDRSVGQKRRTGCAALALIATDGEWLRRSTDAQSYPHRRERYNRGDEGAICVSARSSSRPLRQPVQRTWFISADNKSGCDA